MSGLEQLESFLRKDPSNAVLACDLMGQWLAAGRAEHAIEMLDLLSPGARRDHGVRFYEARARLQSDDAPAAADILRELLADGADAPAIHHDLAYAEFAQGHLEAASEALQPALHGHPPLLDAQRLQARLLHWQGRLDEALRTIDEALAGHPGDDEATGIRALLLLDLNRFDEAGRAALAALSRDPTQLEAGITAGTLALWHQRVNEAVAVFGRTANRHPQAGRALAGLGQAHMLGGNIPEARRVLEHATARMPNHIGTWHALAWCQLLLGDLASAQVSYELAFALDRGFGETHGGFAVLHALRGNVTEAEAAIVRARRLDPNGRSAVYAQALLVLADGRDDEAAALVAPVLAQTPASQATDPLEFLRRLRAQMTRT
ncbi:tetratricopeptide repeat protein [Fulvimonas yonginensis]|uniref:Tetratricopeptide repeat protein n=1 Tax=Fulvimonas yonginensis TaxID=1495200 RepID=A0ABU8JD56_9GAMM